jgi:hypothetical protein
MMQFNANEVLGHLRYKIANAHINTWPYAHFYIEDIFPDDFYRKLRALLPPHDAYKKGASDYNGRVFADPTTTGELAFMTSDEFTQSVVFAFSYQFQARFPIRRIPPSHRPPTSSRLPKLRHRPSHRRQMESRLPSLLSPRRLRTRSTRNLYLHPQASRFSLPRWTSPQVRRLHSRLHRSVPTQLRPWLLQER